MFAGGLIRNLRTEFRHHRHERDTLITHALKNEDINKILNDTLNKEMNSVYLVIDEESFEFSGIRQSGPIDVLTNMRRDGQHHGCS